MRLQSKEIQTIIQIAKDIYGELLPVAKKVKTGDDTRINYYVVIAVLSLIAFSLLFIRKKNHE